MQTKCEKHELDVETRNHIGVIERQIGRLVSFSKVLYDCCHSKGMAEMEDIENVMFFLNEKTEETADDYALLIEGLNLN